MNGGDRYRKVNLQRLGDLGTVEIRHHSATHENEKIIPWVKFCLYFVGCGQRIRGDVNSETLLSGLNASLDVREWFIRRERRFRG
mmetsp:Transcript_59991/g.141948  ORF Transcript_59991/g.141948 Transcript_59991/m.141948 type:complete len:85 (+) Transcript_59991:952-1206(+)